MVRNDLYITIPSLFRCPISLDVMKSPVSLCTGVTYDRSSIQRWLDGGNNTCPATMQVLQSKDFVPNRNLQRLIQIWSDTVRQRADSSESNDNDSPPVLSHDQIVDFVVEVETSSSESKCYDSLSNLVCFAEESEENRNFLAKIDGIVPILADFLAIVDDGACRDIRFVELVVRILDLMLNEIQEREQLISSILKGNRDCLASLILVLKQGSDESQTASVRMIEYIAVDSESKLLITEKKGLLLQLIKLISPEKDPILIKSVLSCLIIISTTKRAKIKLIHLEAVKSLTKLLLVSNMSVSINEKVLKLLEMVSSVKEGRLQISDDSICIPAVVQKLLKVSNSVTEHGVTIIWSVCCLLRDQKSLEAVMECNGVTKILLIMQSNCSPLIKQMAADLLKTFRMDNRCSVAHPSSAFNLKKIFHHLFA